MKRLFLNPISHLECVSRSTALKDITTGGITMYEMEM